MTAGLDIRSARPISPGERAALFNAAYEGYLVPFHIDERQLAFMDDAFDLDLDASRIAFRDGEPVGLGNLGLRGEDAWIGGVGEQARERGVRRVWLEVIVENTGACALYEKLGYRTVRDVEVWSLPAVEDIGTATEVSATEAHARIRELPSGREPWQRADQTLAHYADARGLATDGGAAVYRKPGEHVQLVQLAGEPEALLRSLRNLGEVSVLNLPEDDAAAPVLRELGGSVVLRQHEMLLALEEH